MSGFSSDNFVIVSQALHHLEKALLLRESMFNDVEILNIQQDISKLSTLKETFVEKKLLILETLIK